MDIAFIGFLILVGLFSGLFGGMGGPTGFVVIATLLLFTDLNNSYLAGTTSTMFTFATASGAVLYTLSGDQDWKLVVSIVPFVMIGTQIGVYLNSILPEEAFNLFLGGLALTLGVMIIYDSRRELHSKYSLDSSSLRGKSVFASLGLVVGTIGGVTGLGGISIIVPVLIMLGIPPLVAISAAITQGVATTSTTAIRYILQGSVDFRYVVLIGIPFALAQVVGWKYAHIIKTDRLKLILGLFQVSFGIYMLNTVLL